MIANQYNASIVPQGIRGAFTTGVDICRAKPFPKIICRYEYRGWSERNRSVVCTFERESAYLGRCRSVPCCSTLETRRHDACKRGQSSCLRAGNSLASQGYRIIAVTSRRLDSVPVGTTEGLECELVLQGFLALDDPLRPEVFNAVQSCREAGIGVLLITGDHPQTAVAVARTAGILTAHADAKDAVVLGSELDRLSEPEILRRLDLGATVFARTTPDQKLKIVTLLQKIGLPRRLGHQLATARNSCAVGRIAQLHAFHTTRARSIGNEARKSPKDLADDNWMPQGA